MLLLRARVVKLNTDDGLMPLSPDKVRVGETFIVDLSSKRCLEWLNEDENEVHEKEIIQCAEDGTWLPFECVELLTS